MPIGAAKRRGLLKCFGGASRRNAVLASAADTVRLDLGGYASGSGLFFPALRGEASADFLADGGYSGSTLDAIAARAGVTKGGLYFHFAGKEGLIGESNEFTKIFTYPPQ